MIPVSGLNEKNYFQHIKYAFKIALHLGPEGQPLGRNIEVSKTGMKHCLQSTAVLVVCVPTYEKNKNRILEEIGVVVLHFINIFI